ncbi:MAG: hypothetical protein KBB01_03555 [Candidatus Omnitrophica bacterium]|jgi:hypothetical protein|nr:hypothetical protein [Candidatus Omnitrophota bacterium]
MKKIMLFSSMIFAVVFSNISYVSADENPGDYNVMRIENEDKLVVPKEKTKEVWSYMVERLVNEKTYLKSLDPGFESYYSDELFIDVYFDSPNLQMLEKKSGIRHRKRWNLDNLEHKKSGRELIQVKLNYIDESNELNRGELKFKIDPSDKPNTPDELHPVIGLIDKPQRENFKQRIVELGIDPYSLKKILIIKQLRHSLYITKNSGQFMSIRLDEDSSRKFLVKWEHVELEPELNEIPYTKATPEERERMEDISKQIVADILKKFPEIKRDLTPKYNKAFEYFEKKIPFFRFLVRHFS